MTFAFLVFLLAVAGCSERAADRTPSAEATVGSDDPVALRERAARLRSIAQQFDQEAGTFRNEIPGGQPILQRKAVAADSLRDRAAALDAEARRLEQQDAGGGPKSMPARKAINARAEHRHLAVELRQLAAERRQEAALMAHAPSPDTAAIAETRKQADRLEALADEADAKALQEEQAIPHGMVPQ